MLGRASEGLQAGAGSGLQASSQVFYSTPGFTKMSSILADQ